MGMIEEALSSGRGRIFSIGEVIHNTQAVERLKEQGVIPVSSMEDLKEGDTLIIRAHGVVPQIAEEARRRNIELIDTTCPFVASSQEYSREIEKEGRRVIIIGDESHPEVQGISGGVNGRATIINTSRHAEEMEPLEKAGVVIQTTFSRENAMEIIDILRKKVSDLRVYDTICKSTISRRDATRKLAGDVDMILVVGGRASSNTRRLYQMCLDMGVDARFIETADEIDPAWFESVRSVGVTTGTSTPQWIIDDVLDRIHAIAGSPDSTSDNEI